MSEQSDKTERIIAALHKIGRPVRVHKILAVMVADGFTNTEYSVGAIGTVIRESALSPNGKLAIFGKVGMGRGFALYGLREWKEKPC